MRDPVYVEFLVWRHGEPEETGYRIFALDARFALVGARHQRFGFVWLQLLARRRGTGIWPFADEGWSC